MIINFANLGGGGGGGTTYTAGDNIQISGSTISVTGVTTDEEGEVISRAINDLNDRNGKKLQELTTLPVNPVDGAIYNYQGRLIKYVDGPGKWGEWSGLETMTRYSQPTWGCATLFYGVIPSSMDGELAFGLGYIKSNSADTSVGAWGFFNLDNNRIDVYNNKDKTGSTLYTIALNANSETQIREGSFVNVSWKDNVLQLRATQPNSQILRWCNTSTTNAHYELAEEVPYNYPITVSSVDPIGYGGESESGWLSWFDTNNGKAAPKKFIQRRQFYLNNSGYNQAVAMYTDGNLPLNRMFVPTVSGTTGSMLVSAGDAEPQWKTVAQALGVDFWTGTQDEYDALAPNYNSTTMYIIVEEE